MLEQYVDGVLLVAVVGMLSVGFVLIVIDLVKGWDK